MDEDYQLWIWRGIRLELPGDWEMLRFQRDPAAGRCAFGDAWQMRLELSWRVATSAPDLAAIRRDSVTWLQNSGVEQVEAASALGSAWVGSRGIAHGQAFANFSRFFADPGLLLEIFLWLPEDALESRILENCRPVEEADRGRWRAFGLEVRTALPLRECQAYPGLTRLVFADRGDDPDSRARERLVVERRGMTANWLAPGTTVKAWNRAQSPRSLRSEEGSGKVDGLEYSWVRGALRRRFLTKLVGRVGALARRRKYEAGRYASLAAECPERKELRRVEILTQTGQIDPDEMAQFLKPVGMAVPPHDSREVPLLIQKGCTLPPPASWERTLKARPVRNAAVEELPAGKGGAGVYLRVENVRPRWHRPPLSWFLPWRSHRRLALDALGEAIWRQCDGMTSVLELVRAFASEHRVTFHEARVAVCQYLQTLTQRGLIAIEMENPS